MTVPPAKRSRYRIIPAMDLIEGAINLLRTAPGALFAYYVGAIPFILTFLYFFADMSRSAFARDHSVESSATVAAAFIWMKCWHAVYMTNLKQRCSGSRGERESWSVARAFRLLLMQAAIQPTALFVRPVALLITLPYGWTRAFYENAILYGNGSESGLREVVRKSLLQARLWPGQNHALLAWLTLATIFIWMNVFTGLAFIPWLLKTFFGVETALTHSVGAMMNSTFFIASFGITYLISNPLLKATYVLRCFYGESLHTGDDLKIEIRRLKSTAVGIFVILSLFSLPSIQAAPLPASAPEQDQPIPAAKINRAVDDVLQRREYAWRLPRKPEQERAKRESWFVRWMEGVVRTVKGWLKPVKDWAQSVAEWLAKRIFQDRLDANPSDLTPGAWTRYLRPLAIGLGAILLIILGYLTYRRWKSGRSREMVAEAIPATPDLTAENISPAQLPEDGWLQLASEMQEKGELRLALRALYLAGLAHLGARELVRLARYKSNREYSRELDRHAHDREALLNAFRASVRHFERAWYGMYPVDQATITDAQTNIDRLRTS